MAARGGCSRRARASGTRRLAAAVFDDTHLVITVDGSTSQLGPTPPLVRGDRVEVRVAARGFSMHDGRPESNTAVEAIAPALPRTLSIPALGHGVAVARTEVVLRD